MTTLPGPQLKGALKWRDRQAFLSIADEVVKQRYSDVRAQGPWGYQGLLM